MNFIVKRSIEEVSEASEECLRTVQVTASASRSIMLPPPQNVVMQNGIAMTTIFK